MIWQTLGLVLMLFALVDFLIVALVGSGVALDWLRERREVVEPVVESDGPDAAFAHLKWTDADEAMLRHWSSAP